ncbi:hypothetical protein ACFW9I_33505 [[Kitasatospora] papulosa]|uniref:hypothetical protein n=1 Tax=[Kitasatospora] papulosa TaxID=1464011 RepID=UPI003674050F
MRDLELAPHLGANQIRHLELVLDGHALPGWKSLELLITHLGGRPEQFRPLWEEAQYSVFALAVRVALDEPE